MIDQMMQEEFIRFSSHDLNRPPLEQRTMADEVITFTFVLSSSPWQIGNQLSLLF